MRILGTVRGRILLSFLCAGVIPVLVLGGICYITSIRALEVRAGEYTRDLLGQAAINLDAVTDQAEAASFNVVMDSEVQDVLTQVLRAHDGSGGPVRCGSDGPESCVVTPETDKRISRLIGAAILYQDAIVWGVLSDLSGQVSFSSSKTVGELSVTAAMETAAASAQGSASWSVAPHDPGIVLVARQVRSTRDLTPLGTLVLGVRQEALAGVLGQMRMMLAGTVEVVTTDGTVVASPDRSRLRTASGVADLLRRTVPQGFYTADIDDVRSYVSISRELVTGWRIVAVIDARVYAHDVRAVGTTILVAAGVLLIVALALSWILARRISSPITTLAEDLTRLGEGDLSHRSAVCRSDEIGRLATAFNSLADSVVALLARVATEERTKREYQLQALRMQINPHFLYNTLETIGWMGRHHGAQDVVEVTTSMGSLLRSTIDAPDLVPVEDELASLRSYMTIQRYRFGHGVAYREQVAPEALALMMPSMLLQPLVENALIHGIAPMGGRGTIYVSAEVSDGFLVLAVSDDGAGIERASLDSLRSGGGRQTETAHASVGLTNVMARVAALAPDAPPLEIDSEVGEGTAVTIRLPAVTQNDTCGAR